MFYNDVSVADRLLVDLNERQREAVCAPADRPLAVIAGAGTGKTMTVCARVAWLIGQGVPSERILLLTFTRRAAQEMLGRTRALLAGSVAEEVRVVGGTFHSVAWRLLRLHAGSLGLPARFSVLDPSDVADLIDVAREELGFASRRTRFPRKGTLADLYSRTVNAQRPLSEVVAESFPWCQEYVEEIGAIFRRFGEQKRAAFALDLDDLLLYWHAACRHEQVGRLMGRDFDHILVDEYQDVNALQAEIVAGLRADRPGLTVVGDDLQAIYGFRSASAEHLLSFCERFPQAAVVKLEDNYRSTQPILDIGNLIAAQAERSYPRSLRTDRDGGARPELVFCRDEGEEASELVDRVLEHREQGVLLRQQAVLMRAASHSDVLELELARRQIPFVKYGGIRYLEAAHVKDYLALINVSANPSNWVSWFRLLQLLDGVGPTIARRILDRIDPCSESPEPAWRRWPQAHDLLPASASVGATELVSALEETAALTGAGAQAERLRIALVPLMRERYPDFPPRLRDLEQLAASAATAPSLEQFAADLVLDPPSSSSDLAGPPHLDGDCLILSTLHSAKGLEWEIVHLLHLSDGNIPSDMALINAEGLEEERRLLYVGVTRPRRNLHLYVPLRYYHQPHSRNDSHGLGAISRFLTQHVQQHCQHSRPADQTGEPEPESELAASITVSVDELWR
jgi:DNA helicase-2/ATP-dependent DNA helicase PcrA